MKRLPLVLLTIAVSGCTATVGESQFFYTDPPERRVAVAVAASYSQLPYRCGTVSVASSKIGESGDTLLYFGGNQFRLADGFAPVATAAGFARFARVVSFDYPGRGKTTGDDSVGCFVDAAKAVAALVRQETNGAARIVAHGFSFGGLVAPQASQVGGFDFLVLESTARSAEEWLRVMAPAGFKVRVAPSLVGFDSVVALKGHRAKMLVVTGDADRSAGPEVAKRLHTALVGDGANAELLIVPGRGHGAAFASREALAAVVRLRGAGS